MTATTNLAASYYCVAQKGSVLVIALIFLAILTLAVSTSLRTSILGLRMAGNEEIRVSSFEMAQSIVDEVVGNPDNMLVFGDIGFINCTTNVSGCSATSVVIDSNLLPANKVSNAKVMIKRTAPALAPAPRGINSSADAFFAARFEVDSTYDGTSTNEAKANIVQGVLVLVPRSAQTN
ncbi:MAG: pilus assembly PilX N-terminal domain-containing protein [Proteobacteria bacterium]|nr:pilus assembly PilX N-terminal domain-containing protein [Pseudomonadota bacterium]